MQALIDYIRSRYGIYAGIWTEPSVRLAGNKVNPTDRQGSPARVYGHWLLPTGELTGQLEDHAQSALVTLTAIVPSYRPAADPISDLMARAGVIRVRHSPPSLTFVDLSAKPTPSQLTTLSNLADRLDASGSFVWSVFSAADTDTLADGTDFESLRRYHDL